MALEKTWRWFGLKDSVKLSDLKQMGIEGVVTALHHIPNGEVWPVEEIMKVKNAIEAHGMRWSVVESLPVSEGIKTKSPDRPRLIRNYQESLRNLGKCGIDTVCYNFMPVLDWVRTDLHYTLPSGGEVMYFDFPTFVAFDAFILKRPGAENDYPADIVALAREKHASMTQEEAEKLAHNIIVVTQGFIDGVVDGSTPDYKKVFLKFIDTYKEIDRDRLRQHLADFLRDVVPVAEESGVNLCIHPDDPPFPVLGLPRIVSTKEDFEWIIQQVDSISNGLTFCTGSLSVRSSDKLVDIVKSVGHRIHFLHLRNNVLLPDGCFHEYGHIHGVVDMYAVMKALLEEQQRRVKEGRKDLRMPVRPDHGIKMLDDYAREANPGYPLIGRLKGLAELAGLEMGIERSMKDQQN
ncbi:mannonate dehydratase [Alkaliflexus imshenetskii]|jgi:mannonate dehydratase|uniref:mannonate dehydratase n=1 Tax=Alkaliflexus imshenetskii TaxID=286730 RepID=UPI00047CD05A|nr:mannonate dehydratase [Alkaliflexus imshenetskii]